ncbi:MAG: FAD-dependent oxidoreductase, partial [Chloroflexota bacterium]
ETVVDDFLQTSENWRNLLKHMKSVRTFAFQTWTSASLEDMGWRQDPVMSNTGTRPVNLRADSTQLIQWEDWAPHKMPKNRTYYGGFLPDDPNEPTTPAPEYPATQTNHVREMAMSFLEDGAQVYWPSVLQNGGFPWDILIAEDDIEGRDRIDSQFMVANIDPTMRYVQSPVGSSKFRLHTDQSGYDNLFLAGDWTRTGLNIGTVEAAIVSGKLAASALTGEHIDVWGAQRIQVPVNQA